MWVHYTVQTTTPPVQGSYELDVPALTLGALRASWPFEGEFAFRARVQLDGTHAWQDLVSDETPIAAPDGNAVVRALPLFDVGEAVDAPDYDVDPVAYDAWRAGCRRDTVDIARTPITFSAGGASVDLESSSSASAGRASSSGGAGAAAAASDDGWGAADDGSSWRPRSSTGGSGVGAVDAGGAAPAAAAVGAVWKGLVSSAAKGISAATSAAAAAAETVEKKGWFNGLTRTIAKTVGGVVASTAAGGGGGGFGPEPAPASDGAVSNLRTLHRLFRAQIDSSKPAAQEALRKLWDAANLSELAAGASFAVPSPAWQKVGFHSDDPGDDLHCVGGALALHALIHFAHDHEPAFGALVMTNSPASTSSSVPVARRYPVASVVMALSTSLSRDLLGLDTHDESSLGARPAPYWEFFAGCPPGAAHERWFDVIIATVRAFDHEWTVSEATTADFARVQEAAVSRARGWMARGPRSAEELYAIVAADGIVMGDAALA